MRERNHGTDETPETGEQARDRPELPGNYDTEHYESRNIRVNAVCSGPFLDPGKAACAGDPGFSGFAGRPGRPGEVAGPVVFLASEAASCVTGHVLLVADGGWTAWKALPGVKPFPALDVTSRRLRTAAADRPGA